MSVCVVATSRELEYGYGLAYRLTGVPGGTPVVLPNSVAGCPLIGCEGVAPIEID